MVAGASQSVSQSVLHNLTSVIVEFYFISIFIPDIDAWVKTTNSFFVKLKRFNFFCSTKVMLVLAISQHV